jgi:acyl-coenzyme A synthetase/AMP-(fatty) acid ligase/acyl carrier protein
MSFDVSFQEIFTTWCSGGTLILIPEELRRDSAALLRFLCDESVTRVFLPFVALQQLAEAASQQPRLRVDLREIITAGEQLQITRQIVHWFVQLKDCSLCNQYGPSETHVVTVFELAGSPRDWTPLPPIGRPISNTELFLLDGHLNPVPIGVPGELYIGGESLARGYLNRPELTAEKFIPHLFAGKPGERLYKTGDKARYLSDGNIEFLGRNDDQVKVRGYRIELGEIEVALRAHPQVNQTVVLAREDSFGDKRLVAYVVGGNSVKVHDLRGFLKSKLPDYMVPSSFVVLDTLPLTPNRKIDRRALPAPNQDRPELENAFVAPRTRTEELIAAVWTETLKIERVGIHDHFFEIGGHSLLATQVVSRLRVAFGIDLPLRNLFEYPTVADLAERIEAVSWAGTDYPGSPASEPEEREEVKF